VLTFAVEQFSVLFVPGGRSARAWRTVRAQSVHRVFVVFLLGIAFDPFWFQALVRRGFGRSAAAARTVRGCLADSPRAPRGRSIFRSSLLVVLLALTDSPRPRPDGPPYLCRGTLADSSRGPCGQSTPPGRTVRQSLAALLFGSIPPFLLSCFRVCFKESFLRLEVDP
jgi:hypothetical protein